MFDITDFGRWLKRLKFQHFVKKEFYEEKLIYPVIETFNLEFVEKWKIMQKCGCERVNRFLIQKKT